MHALPYARATSPPPMPSKAKPNVLLLNSLKRRKLSGDDRYSSIARLKAPRYWGVPKIDALYEATYFAGLRKAGMPEE